MGSADPQARFMHGDPLIHVTAPNDSIPEVLESARGQSDAAFEAWDMLSGRTEPQLGGSPQLLDIVGINYYHDNQWTDQGPGQRSPALAFARPAASA